MMRHSDLALINKLEQVKVSKKDISKEHKGINTIFLRSSPYNGIISSLLFNKKPVDITASRWSLSGKLEPN